MTVAFQRMLGILEGWNNNQVTPSLSEQHELSYRSNKSKYLKLEGINKHPVFTLRQIKINIFG